MNGRHRIDAARFCVYAMRFGVGFMHRTQANMVNNHYFQNNYFAKLAPVLDRRSQNEG
jgi:hypothetical protein